MDLVGGYLLIILVLFSANLALLYGNLKLNHSKIAILSLGYAVISFVLINISQFLNFNILEFLGYVFFILAMIIFLCMIYYEKFNNLMIAIYSISAIFFISMVLFSSQTSLLLFDTVVYSLLVFITLFFVYQLSKLLIHAKRQYPVIIGEFMCLFSILVFIFALTFNSTMNLDYTMFKSFLILTPLYQLIYVIIGIVIVMIIGVFLNESKGGNS